MSYVGDSGEQVSGRKCQEGAGFKMHAYNGGWAVPYSGRGTQAERAVRGDWVRGGTMSHTKSFRMFLESSRIGIDGLKPENQ